MVAPTQQMLDLELTTKTDISNSLFHAFQNIINGLPPDEVAAATGGAPASGPVPASGPTGGSGFSTPGTAPPPGGGTATPGGGESTLTEQQLTDPLTVFEDPGPDSTAEPASQGPGGISGGEPAAVATPDTLDEVPDTVTRKVFTTQLAGLDNTTADIDRGGQLVTARVAALLDMMQKTVGGESSAFTLTELQKMLVTAFNDPEFAGNRPEKEDDKKGLTSDNPAVDQETLDQVPPGPNSDLLQLFLESNEQAVFQAMVNGLRHEGVSGVFLRFLSNNFPTIWGMYLGELAQKAINGEDITDTRFVDWLQRFDSTGTFFSLSAFERGDPTTRFASHVTQSGVQ